MHLICLCFQQQSLCRWPSNYSNPSILSFLLSPSLTCCMILPTSFGGKGPHLKWWLVTQASLDGLLARVFLGHKENARRSVHSPQYNLISASSLANKHVWSDTWCKWPWLGTWRHYDPSLKLFWLQPMAPWATGPAHIPH